MRCKYLSRSDEAYAISSSGIETPATVHLCDWPDQHPERFRNAPRWLLRQIGPGLAIEPARDCAGCPAFAAAKGG
ncbi:hypothetical protein [Mesorhizobium xinjiangense]|uniref:hypothetical protein n=1 Tax=Mesorhizobium xinjiangense TaxID=2678685 RepID=UPI0012EDF876|nr:hypothetical protein [Mesorhizobium xinjiangense]